MALIQVLTTPGANRRTSDIANANSSPITRISAGSGHVTTEALAKARAALVSPLNPVRQVDNPIGVALPSDPFAQWTYTDADAVTYDIHEIGLWAGNLLVWYICDDAGAVLFTKTPLLFQFGVLVRAESGDYSTFPATPGYSTAPLATTLAPGLVRLSTNDEDDAGTVAIKSSTPKGVARYVARWWAALTSLQLRNKIVMATSQQARRGTGSGVMTSELTKEAISALSPDPAFALQAQARVGTNATGYMNPALATDHFEARIKVQDSDPVAANADNGLTQVWLVH